LQDVQDRRATTVVSVNRQNTAITEITLIIHQLSNSHKKMTVLTLTPLEKNYSNYMKAKY